MTIVVEPVALEDVPWSELDRRPDRTVHQTRAWLDFLAETQRATPVVLRLVEDGRPVGWFTGATVRRYGLRVLGSPMRGWSTAHMGFNLDDDRLIGPATRALIAHAFAAGCWHVEVMDHRSIGPPQRGVHSTPLHGLEVRIDLDDDALLSSMTAHGRRDVRRALRLGAEVEEVDPSDPTFVEEHYAQVCAAFARRGRVPPYPSTRVESLIRHLHPAGHLLLLRVRLPDGTPAASGVFAGLPGGGASFTWQASHPEHHRWSPNELIVWDGLRRWRDRGAVRFDLGGRDPDSPKDFKGKFGGAPTTTEWLRSSRFGALETARSLALAAHRRRGARGTVSGSPSSHVD